jgi:tRNA-dihydrouridine synthase B
MLKLGRITLDIPFIQAPLSGYSDYAMRRMARSFGAPLTFGGVMLAKSAAHPKVVTLPAFRPRDDEHPVGAQILGNDPETMAKAARELAGAGYDLIDLNFACPAPKVLRRRRGGYLLKEPHRVIEIYRRVREAVDCPVLMKLRIGYDNSQASRDSFRQIVSAAACDGVDALIVHGRSVLQRFTHAADWRILGELKRRFPGTTIIGSGDLFEAHSITENLVSSGIDGALIARGAIGNPWIFRDLRTILTGGTKPSQVTLDEQADVISQHFELVSAIYPHKKAVRYFRKFIVGYCKRHPDRKKVQKALLSAEDRVQLLATIKQWYRVA